MNKNQYTFLSFLVLVYLFGKNVLELINYNRAIENETGIITFAVTIILVSAFGFYYQQKNWRIAYLMIWLGVFLDYMGKLTAQNIRLILYVASIPLLIVGFVNLYLFYKSDFKPPLEINKKEKKKILILVVSVTMIIATIFLIFSWSSPLK